nr:MULTISPECIES: hypothetical protein [unclassified Paenibacillus]
MIEFLLQNWVVVAIAFFVLSSMFRKGGARSRDTESGQGRGRQQGGMPTFGGGPGKPGRPSSPLGGDRSGWPTSAEAPPVRRQQPSGPVPGQPQRRASTGRQDAAERVDVSGRSWDLPEAASRSEAASRTVRQDAAEKPGSQPSPAPASRFGDSGSSRASEGLLGDLRPEEVARGVLWAEILGPPRAKRPYRRH